MELCILGEFQQGTRAVGVFGSVMLVIHKHKEIFHKIFGKIFHETFSV